MSSKALGSQVQGHTGSYSGQTGARPHRQPHSSARIHQIHRSYRPRDGERMGRHTGPGSLQHFIYRSAVVSLHRKLLRLVRPLPQGTRGEQRAPLHTA